MNHSRFHWLIIALVPAMISVCVLCWRRPVHTGPPPAFHSPGRALLLAPEQAAGFRSLSHPFAVPPPVDSRNRGDVWNWRQNRFAPAATGPNATWYSAGVNSVLCSLLLPDETWLGTAFGVKRLNLQTHQTRHYTALDGLPYPRITAIAGHNGVVVCAALRQEAKSAGNAPANYPVSGMEARAETAALCRFDMRSGKWRVLDEDRREYDIAEPPDGMETKAIPPQCVAVNRGFACLSPGVVLPGTPIALLCRLSDGSVDRVAAPTFITQPLAITTAQMDEQYLWLGSSRGLLRCNLDTRNWDILLPEASIYSSAQAADGNLWLLAKTAGPFRRDIQQGMVRDTRWDAVHIEHGQITRSYPLNSRVEPQHAFSPSFLENITLAEGKVWATVNISNAGIHAQMAYLPQVFSLEPQTGKVTILTEGNGNPEYAQIPASALANSHTGLGVLTPLRIPSRFPGWVCEAKAVDAAQLVAPNPMLDRTTAQRQEWNFVGMGGSIRAGKFLQYRAGNQNPDRIEDGELYALPSAHFDAQDEARWPTLMKDVKDGREKVYFLSGQYDVKLRVWDRAANVVSTPPEVEAALKQFKPQWPYGYTLLPGNGCLWIGTGEHVLRYDLASGRVTAAQDTTRDVVGSVPRHALLSIEGDTAWVKGAPNLLYSANPSASAELTPVAVPPFPGDLERQRDKLVLFALEDHIAWFTGLSFAAPNNRVVIGYNLAARTWTAPFDASLALISAGQTLATYRVGNVRWFPAYSREASAYGYDMATGQWTMLPPVPKSENNISPELVAVDARHAWYCNYATLYRLDRQQGTWHHESLPFTYPELIKQGVTRAGDTLYFGSGSGAWLLDTNTGQWSQSPGITLAADALEYRVEAVDANAVWLTASRADTQLVARFERGTHVWKYWSARDGVPAKYFTLTGDGQSCWLLTNDTLYHLNPQTNHWDNLSRRLAGLKPGGAQENASATGAQSGHGAASGAEAQDQQGEENSIRIKQILADGSDVWLVPDTRPTQPNRPPTAYATPLYRYEIATRQLTPVQPAPGKLLTPGAVTATDRGLLLATHEGVYRLDRGNGNWRSVAVPTVPASFPRLTPAAAREDPENVWIIGEENALRFRKRL